MANCSIYGKSLEFSLCQKFMDSGIQLNAASYKRYAAYEEKWDKLAKSQKEDFINFSTKIVNWCKLDDFKNLNVSLAADNQGRRAAVADVLINGSKSIHLSIKNNKDYAKSHRPSGFPDQAKLQPDMSAVYKYIYKTIIKRIYQRYQNLEKFSEIEAADKQEYIYKPLYNLTERYLNSLNAQQINAYFEFLVGSTGFYQCLNTRKEIIIYDRTKKLPTAHKLSCSRNKNGHIVIEFKFPEADPVKISMRLHTASSKITKAISVKFDAKIITAFYKKIVIAKN